MLIPSFLYAAVLLVLGFLGLQAGTDPNEARALGLPGLYFGGGALLCSFFALKEPRHGLAGATFLAFIAVLTNAMTIGGPLFQGTFDWSDPRHRLSTLIAGASVVYLATSIRWWKRQKRAEAIAALSGGPPRNAPPR
jgi:hypothetical protein